MEPNFKEMFMEAFGRPFTARELWVITLFSKRVRKYARNNGAFNNLANRAFPYANFREVLKTKASGETYKGLQINVKGDDFTPSDEPGI